MCFAEQILVMSHFQFWLIVRAKYHHLCVIFFVCNILSLQICTMFVSSHTCTNNSARCEKFVSRCEQVWDQSSWPPGMEVGNYIFGKIIILFISKSLAVSFPTLFLGLITSHCFGKWAFAPPWNHTLQTPESGGDWAYPVLCTVQMYVSWRPKNYFDKNFLGL